MATSRIVVIEDEADIREVISYNLGRGGFDVVACEDGEAGLAALRGAPTALVLLDLMLPGVDGLEVCRRLRADPATRRMPVVMVTARGEEADVVRGLELGADDYVVKPFRPRELVARVRAVLRRHESPAAPDLALATGGLSLDAGRHALHVDGQPVTLTATEMRLLSALVDNRGRVLTRDQLLVRLRGSDSALVDRNIDVHIGQIRQKLGPYRDRIETVRGVGYRFVDEP